MSCPTASDKCDPSAYSQTAGPISSSSTFFIRYVGCQGTWNTLCLGGDQWVYGDTATSSNPVLEVTPSLPTQAFQVTPDFMVKGFAQDGSGYLIYSPTATSSNFKAVALDGKPFTFGSPFTIQQGVSLTTDASAFLSGTSSSDVTVSYVEVVKPGGADTVGRMIVNSTPSMAAVFVAYPAPSGYSCTSQTTPCQSIGAAAYKKQNYATPATSVYVDTSCGSACGSAPNPCQGVTCANGTCDPSTGKCACNPCYSGTQCGTECSGNGTCSNGTCTCRPEWTGPSCATSTSGKCTPTSCVNGTCDATTGACTCDACYSGTKCDVECSGHGTCTNGKCVCQTGYSGTLCDDSSSSSHPKKGMSKGLKYGLIIGSAVLVLIIIIAVAAAHKKPKPVDVDMMNQQPVMNQQPMMK